MDGEQRTSQLTRRTLVASAGGASAVALGGKAALGHGDHGPGAGKMQTFQDANLPTPREQTVVIEQSPINIWDSFNPFIPNGEAGQYGLTQLAREYMFYSNFLTGEVTPWLAESYEYNADFTQCTLMLNPNVTWNDGEPFTGEDVVFTQTLLLNNSQLNGAAAAIRDVAAVSATDDHTVVWELTAPNARFHYRFIAGISTDALRVVPRHIWENEDPGTFKFNPPVQTGPYVLVEASSTLLYYLWEKRPNYWNAANLDPAPQYVVYRVASEIDSSVQAFLAGNLDLGWNIDYLNQEVIASQYEQTAQFNFPDPCPRSTSIHQPASSPRRKDAGQCPT